MAEMEKKTVNAMGDVCPVPLVKAKNAIAELAGSGKVEVLVDNEIAVQNLEKMAQQKGYGFLVKEKKEKEQKNTAEAEPSRRSRKKQNTHKAILHQAKVLWRLVWRPRWAGIISTPVLCIV